MEYLGLAGPVALAGVVVCFIFLLKLSSGVKQLGTAVTTIGNELKKLSGGK